MAISKPPPDLPYELLAAIFTLAAEEHLSCAQALCLVSHGSYAIAAPLLYQCVGLSSIRQINKFVSKVSDRNKAYVTRLAIRQKYEVPVVGKLIGSGLRLGESSFAKCINVEHLALCTPFPDKELKELRPKYLHVGFADDPCLRRPDYAFMANVTHLRLWFVMYHTRQLVAMVERFSNVTHFRVQLDYDSLFDRFRNEFPKDIAQILSYPKPQSENPTERTKPVTLVLGICPSRYNVTKDVVADFLRAIDSQESCEKALSLDDPHGKEEMTDDASASCVELVPQARPQLVVVYSRPVEETRLRPKKWVEEMKFARQIW